MKVLLLPRGQRKVTLSERVQVHAVDTRVGVRAGQLLGACLPLACLGCSEWVDLEGRSRVPGPGAADACVESSLPPTTRVRRVSKVELKSATAALLDQSATHALDNVEADPQIDGRYSNSDQLVASASFLGGLELSADQIGTDFKTTVTSTAYDSPKQQDASGKSSAISRSRT